MDGHVVNQTYRDGAMFWKVARLIKLAESLEPFDIPLKHLNIYDLYPKVNSTLDFVQHVRLILSVNVNCPIILDGEGYVMDGRHRVIRAVLDGAEFIPAVRFEETPDCCYTRQES